MCIDNYFVSIGYLRNMKAFGLTNRKIYKHLGGGLYCGKKNNFPKPTENGKKSTNLPKTTENGKKVKLVS